MPCSHLQAFMNKGHDALDAYKTIHANLITPWTNPGLERKAKASQCFMPLSNHSMPMEAYKKLHACLHCIHVACQAHRNSHSLKKSHPLSVELVDGNVYCQECGDYVYDSEFEAVSDAFSSRASKNLGHGSRYHPWRPTPSEISLLKTHKKRKGFSTTCIANNSTIGLRGLINLGNTCFMSCIVQTLIHTPIFRDYFLSDRHICLYEGDRHGQCIVCEVSRLFQEFYSGAKTPLVPHVLLHMTWQHAHHLAGYEQQDAHEFFIATLDLLHRHLIIGTNTNSSTCDCIVDTIFTGKLQSDVVCQTCKSVSTTIDPFWDISLDLPTVLTKDQTTPISLHDCLERFTKPEHLGSSAKIRCSSCKSNQESTKQLTMKKLPIVASFHLKRFEHSSKLHKKISTRIAFPENLNMTPFVSHKRNNARSSDAGNENMYTLFAVINHIGNIEAGHYTSFVRQHKGKWYQCNDHQIVPASIEKVLESEGYLLFYHKQILEYN